MIKEMITKALKAPLHSILAVGMAVLLVFGVVAASAPVAVNAVQTQPTVEIILNGRVLHQNADIGFAEIIDGRTFVPLRLVSEAMGFVVGWQVDGPGMITLRGNGTTIFHRVGTLYASNSPFPGGQMPFVIDVPSFISPNGRTMVSLRLIMEAFNAEVQWERAPSGMGVVIITSESDGLIWLDEYTSVNRLAIIERLAEQQVIHNRTGQTTRTIREQNRDWSVDLNDPRYPMIRPNALVQRAEGFMQNVYNIDYRTMTAQQFVGGYFEYLMNTTFMNAADVTNIRGIHEGPIFDTIKNQQLVMNSVFVTDASLTYMIANSQARLNNMGNVVSHQSNFAVRGTLIYQFESEIRSNTLEDSGDFWTAHAYQPGEWYFIDIEIRFMIPNYMPLEQAQVTTWTDMMFAYTVNGENRVPGTLPMQHISILPQ